VTPSVRVRGLTKSYGAFQAIKAGDFEIVPGEVFGMLDLFDDSIPVTDGSW